MPIKRKNDQGAQQGLPNMVQPVVSPSVSKRRKGNYEHAINQTATQNKVTTTAQAPVLHVSFPATQTLMQGTVVSGQLPSQRLEHLQQNQPPERSVPGEHQIVPPSPATGGSSLQVPVQNTGGDPLEVPPGESSVLRQVLYYDTLIVLQCNILNVQNVPTCIALYQR